MKFTKRLSRSGAALVLAITGVITAAPAVSAAPAFSASLQANNNPVAPLRFNNFTAFEASGTGTRTVRLPATRSAAIVHATWTGTGQFRIQGLDEHNQSVSGAGFIISHWTPFNVTEDFEGSGAWGLRRNDYVRVLQIHAEGPWTIRVTSVNEAPPLPRSGTGPGVFRWTNPATDWEIRHEGRSNFAIWTVGRLHSWGTTRQSALLVNEIGDWRGTVAAPRGPVIVEISADGNWRINR